MPNLTYTPINDDLVVFYGPANFDNPLSNTTTVVMMIIAWFILIVGFSVFCCSQCFKGGFWLSKWRSCGLDGGVSESGDDWYDTSSIATIANERDRTNNNDPVDICRSYPPNYEVESLPSYTIVSGLPTYDDALEQFRKAGIILTPQIPIIKIFEAKDNKDGYNMDNGLNELDSISIGSCNCGANNINNSQQYLTATPPNSPANSTQFIELTPEQLAQLSQKRLSLQIAFPQTVRRNSRPRVDMRNNLLRSRAVGNTAGYGESFPEIHRALSTFSLAHERNNALQQHHMQHRGSLF